MEQFEKQLGYKPAKEPKEIWHMQAIYCDGEVNKEFISFRKGYAFAKAIYQQG